MGCSKNMGRAIIFNIMAFTFILLPNLVSAQDYLISQGGTVTTCSGSFYDSGGKNGQYSDRENFTMTFTSENGELLQFDFSEFDVEPNGGSCYDYLEVYDGGGTNSTLLGSYCTPALPLQIVSSGNTITFKFYSDTNTTRSGWKAQISCLPPPDVSVEKKLNPDNPPFTSGQNITYEIVVTNGGAVAVTDIEIKDLSKGLSGINSVTGCNGTVTSSSAFNCTIPSIPAGGNVTLTVNGTVE